METNEKQRRGRPPGGEFREIPVSVRLPDTLLAAIDQHCRREGCSRSELFRLALVREVRRLGRHRD